MARNTDGDHNGVTPNERKARLLDRGITLAMIRTELVLEPREKKKPSVSHISRVICGKRRSKRIERAAAKLMGVSVAEAFG
jgi:hypothetical protein